MTTPCIITVAITGSLPKKKDNPAVPITVAEQIASTREAYEAGAALVHLHVRNDDESPTSDPDRFAKLLEGIRQQCPGMITQISTGGRSGAGHERGAMLSLKPDMASLATGSVNFPTRVYDNSPELVDWLATEMLALRDQAGGRGVRPVDDLPGRGAAEGGQDQGTAARAVRHGCEERDAGGPRGLPVLRSNAETPGARCHLDRRRHRPRPGDADPVVLELGGHCRTGFEDNVRLDRDTLAPSNAALVRQAADLCGEYDRRPATIAEARQLLSLPPAA